MTPVTPALTSPSAGVPATKFGIAIGSGANSPSGMGTRLGACARAPRDMLPASKPTAAIPDIIRRRLVSSGNAGRALFLIMAADFAFTIAGCDHYLQGQSRRRRISNH